MVNAHISTILIFVIVTPQDKRSVHRNSLCSVICDVILTVFVYIVSNKVELNTSGRKRATSILPKGLYSFEVIFAMQSREGWWNFVLLSTFIGK
jgi:hypothetical protein